MKRIISTLFLFLSIYCLIFAEPADPTPRKVIQSNGDTILISLHGDEYGSWYEDNNGYVISLNNNGVWVYVAAENGEKVLTNQIVSQTSTPININKDSVFNVIRQQRIDRYSENQDFIIKRNQSNIGEYASLPTIGQCKILTVLVQFADVSFQNPNGIKQEIINMMNQVNYRHPEQTEITGSMRDFYLKASYNQLDISATVIGPYTVSNNRIYYGDTIGNKNDSRPQELAEEIMEMVVNDINVSQFDNNDDGWVECIHIIYAGQGQNVPGAPKEAIWPHKWSLENCVQGDGVKMSRYIMTPELYINSYRGVGTICHELGHILGAPDFYDVKNNIFKGTGKFDLMCGGNWNGTIPATCPAHPNPYIKTEIYGWINTIDELSGNDSLYTMRPAELDSNGIYKLSTSTNNEYYFLENRQDIHLPGTGLVIYHINSSIPTSNINITHPQNLYVVDANNHIEKPTGSVASYGNINSPNATFRSTHSQNMYFTSTSKPSNCAWNYDTTYNKDVCFISEEMIDGEKCIKFVLNPEIEGPDILCDSAIYSLKHIPSSNVTIEWTYTRPSGIPLTSVPLYIGSGQGTKAVYYKRGIKMTGSTIPPGLDIPVLPVSTTNALNTAPYSGFVTISAKVTLNGNTFTLSKEIYMPEKVVINDVNLGSLGVWYVGAMQSITLQTPTDDAILEKIRWDIKHPNGNTQTAYGSSVVVRPDSKGTLTVTATYLDGCGDEYESYTKTFSIVSAFNLTFANPASGSVEINVTSGDVPDESGMQTMSVDNQQTPYMGAYRVELWHDIYGKVREMEVPENNPTITMNLEGLNSGVYVLRLIIDNQVVEISQLIVK